MILSRSRCFRVIFLFNIFSLFRNPYATLVDFGITFKLIPVAEIGVVAKTTKVSTDFKIVVYQSFSEIRFSIYGFHP